MNLSTNRPLLPPYNNIELNDEYRRLEGIPLPPARALIDAVTTIGVMFGLLLASSVTLGLIVHQATIASTALTQHVLDEPLNTLKTPTSWRF